MVVNLYKDTLKTEQAKVFKSEFIKAFATGFSQFNTYFIIGGLFFIGGLLVHLTEDDGPDAI